MVQNPDWARGSEDCDESVVGGHGSELGDTFKDQVGSGGQVIAARS